MKKNRYILLILLISAIGTVASFGRALKDNHREFSLSKEKELHIIIDVSFGSISIEHGEHDKIAEIDYDEEDGDKDKLYISYDIHRESGTLNIKLKEPTKFWSDDDDESGHHRRLKIKLSDAVPISFDIELGAGKGDIDLTGLQVKDLNISTGASSVTLECSKPNPITADEIIIESGVSKFTATDLSNLNFRNLKFSGGVGAYKLDFDGTLLRSAEVEIEVGLGSISVYIPKTIPAKLVYDDNWLSSFRLDNDFEEKHDGVYETDDFQDGTNHLIIRLEAGLGSVKVKRK